MGVKEFAANREFLGDFVRRPLPVRPVRTTLIVFLPPSLDDLRGLGQRPEPMCVQALGSQRPVERFHVRVVGVPIFIQPSLIFRAGSIEGRPPISGLHGIRNSDRSNMPVGQTLADKRDQ